MWKKLGDFEKTNKLTVLFNDLKEVYSQKREIIESFFINYKEVIIDLEMAYIENRYLPATFFKEQVNKMIEFVEKLQDLLESL